MYNIDYSVPINTCINKSQIKQFGYHNSSFTFNQQENVSGK